jgi:amidase
MQFADYIRYDATGLADLVSRREVSVSEVAETAKVAIDRLNPTIGAVIETWPDGIAEGLDLVPPEAPFRGVPFLVKDILLQAQGRLSESGSRLCAGIVAADDSALMHRFRAAGLVTLGRTKTPEFGLTPTTEPLLYGPTANPWDLTRSAGGSSGGAAAAVASGMVPVAHASDAGGSIRIPAAACGLVGLKPSRGRISAAPGADEIMLGLGAEFIVSRTVRDTAGLLDALHGAEPGDPFEIRHPTEPFTNTLSAPGQRYRIAMMLNGFNGAAPAPEMALATNAVAALCNDLGHEIVAVDMPLGVSHDAYVTASARIWCSGLAAWVRGISAATGRRADISTLEPATLACLEFGHTVSGADIFEALAILNQVRRSAGSFFQTYDLLLTPTLPGEAWTLGSFDMADGEMDGIERVAQVFDRVPYTTVANAIGTPAISLPLNQSKFGMPLGTQFSAAFGNEAALIAIASQLEATSPWSRRRPLTPAWSSRKQRSP